MPSKLILDPSEPGIDEVVASAVVGQPLTLSAVIVIPTIVDDGRFEADIAELSVDAAASAIQPEPGPEAAEADQMMANMPMTDTGIDEGIL